jgi:heptosyltransferase-2
MLRKRRYDRCYVLRRSLSGAFLALLSGIPHRVGFSTEGGAWLLQRSTPYPEKHEVECFLDVLRADGIPIRDLHNENWTDPAIDNEVDRVLPMLGRKRVFFCTKPSIVAKEWRPERFAAVAAWLIGERHSEIHVCDAPANAAYYAAIRDLLPPALQLHWHDWSARLRLLQLPSLLRRMAVYFGVDTGLTHLAASLHVPVIAMYEPWMAQRWSPWDTRHELLLGTVSTPGTSALDSISVEDVCAAFSRISAAVAQR